MVSTLYFRGVALDHPFIVYATIISLYRYLLKRYQIHMGLAQSRQGTIAVPESISFPDLHFVLIMVKCNELAVFFVRYIDPKRQTSYFTPTLAPRCSTRTAVLDH